MGKRIAIKTALVSVSDKRGLPQLAAALAKAGVHIIATGNTARALRRAGAAAQEVADFCGGDAAEMLGGRVKSLQANIHAGILADRANRAHMQELRARGLKKIDLVVVNFYDFSRARNQNSQNPRGNAVIEFIDIGGPAMARAAAKNHACTVALSNPDDYPAFIAALGQGGVPPPLSKLWAGKVFAQTARMDAEVAGWFAASDDSKPKTKGKGAPVVDFAENEILTLRRRQIFRYGENPHQRAAAYSLNGEPPLEPLAAKKEVSYNNMLDALSAWRALCALRENRRAAAVVVKHNNPCGAAAAASIATAVARARQTDSVSAFGGIIAINKPPTARDCKAICEEFVEAAVAPDFDEKARAWFAKNRPQVRLFATRQAAAGGLEWRIFGTLALAQTADDEGDDERAFRVVSKKNPTKKEQADLIFAWRLARAVKSNAIVLARDAAAAGIGAGQMSRVDAARLAVQKAEAGIGAAGSVAASDGFLPFADNIEVLAAAGVRALIQPGGSVRDKAIIAAADRANIAMMFTARRHFLH